MTENENLEVIFGKVIKEYRHDVGLSQESLALIAGVDRTFVSLLERGKRQPTLRTIFKFSQAFGIPASSLILSVQRRIAELQGQPK